MGKPEIKMSWEELSTLVNELRAFMRTKKVPNARLAGIVAAYLHYSYCMEEERTTSRRAFEIFLKDTERVLQLMKEKGPELFKQQ